MAFKGRRLLPDFRPQTNVPDLPPGRWTLIQSPTDLARVAVPEEDGGSFRSRVQSVPSPWARLLLFRDALLDPEHPARTLVENELLDVFELVWLGQPHGARLDTDQLRLAPVLSGARGISARVADYADALEDLAPRRRGAQADAASGIPVLTLGRLEGRVVFASSPYTVVFTAEDAEVGGFPHLFQYARGGRARPLHERPYDFQLYVATVLLPQLSAPRPAADEHVDAETVKRGVGAFLQKSLEHCRRAAPQPADFNPPADWSAHARTLDLEPAGGHAFAGVTLYTGKQGTFHSRWLLHPLREGEPPLVLLPEHFDGVYGEGLPPVKLPGDVRTLPRDVLPGTGYRRDWVLPEADWLADQLVVLSDPVNVDNSYGFGAYEVDRTVTQPPFARPQLALPLKAGFFRYFRPEDVDGMLKVEVLAPGDVRVTLEVPVGPRGKPQRIRVQRRYTAADIRMDLPGPQLVVWPDFRAPEWSDYALFRVDRPTGGVRSPDALQVAAFSAGNPLPASGQARRNEQVQTYAFREAPEVLQLAAQTAPGFPAEVLGVLLPRYREAPLPTAETWRVGVDFGTANTVLAVHRDSRPDSEILEARDVVLSLLHPGADTPAFLESFFLPDTLPGRPFNTAVVHADALQSYDPAAEPLLLRVNIPFSGWVKNDKRNHVAAELKWSKAARDNFLAQAFLRTTTALTLAHARRAGVLPRNVTVSYAFPQAFEEDRIEALRDRWKLVLSHHGGPGAGPRLDDGMEESRSVLRYFVSGNVLGTSGALSVILDVGGGTTDLAAYARSQAQALDSLRWGGRDLTGSRARGRADRGFSNPFVQAFVEWARTHGLPPSQVDPLDKYAEEGLDALAFSYLIRSRWYEGGEGLNFQESAAADAFRALVLYFFAALFHYVGLMHRGLRADGMDEPVVAVVMSGNGARFLEWLQRDWTPGRANPFRDVLLDVLARSSGVSGAPVTVTLSPAPKEEVARGLVTPRGGNAATGASRTTGSVVGERVRVERPTGPAREHDVTSRLRSFLPADASLVGGVRWEAGEMEIERFHRSLVEGIAARLSQRGGPWQALAGRLETYFQRLGRAGIQQATMQRLEQHVNESGGVPGSIFMVEAAAVLDGLMDEFLVSR